MCFRTLKGICLEAVIFYFVTTFPKHLTPIVYVDHAPDRRETPFMKNAKLCVSNPGSDPFDFFSLLANDDFFGLIIQETNFYANDFPKKIGTLGLG